jgi:transketolase
MGQNRLMIDPLNVKKQVLKVAYESNKGHIGSALSIVDILVGTFNHFKSTNQLDQKSNSITLSKGHAALAFYCCLFELNLISKETLLTYEKDNSIYGTHPDPEVPWVNFVGGSLGQGFAFATGNAIADKLSNKSRNHYVILSDSELNAGVTWEIATIAGTKEISNLIVILDNNKQQALDLTKNILIYQNIPESFKLLGWEVSEINGHDTIEISKVLNRSYSKPHLIIANTTFGAGISFMKENIAWHYLPMDEQEFNLAMNEIETLK